MEIIKPKASIKNLTEKVKNFGEYIILVGYSSNSRFHYIGGNGLKVSTDLVIFHGKKEYIRNSAPAFHYDRCDILIKDESAKIEQEIILTQVKGRAAELIECYENDPFCGSYTFYLRKMLFFDSEEEMNLYIEINFRRESELINIFNKNNIRNLTEKTFNSEEEMNLYIEMNFEKVQEGIKTNEKQF